MSDLAGQISSVAGSPAHAAVDGGDVTAQPLAALIAADKYLAGKTAAGTKNRGIRRSKIVPAGAMPDDNATLQGPSFSQGGMI